ncbi:MAG: hypothetical protein JXR11_03905 [Balneola sp.]|jgi:hypothetical protein
MELVISYLILTSWEVYLFTIQRACLEFSRALEIDQHSGRVMLPWWYGTLWFARIARWALIFFIFKSFGWVLAISLLLIPTVLNIFIPIPYKHSLRTFINVIHKQISLGKTEPYIILHTQLKLLEKDILNQPNL